MADYIVKDTELTSVANAIRTAGGTNSLLSFPNGFVSAVNNISGGGGSSDLSIAKVTLIETATGLFSNVQFPAIEINDLVNPPVECIMTSGIYGKTGTANVDVALYNGNATIFTGNDTSHVTPTVTSGNAEVYTYSDEWGTYADVLVKGDCTITYSSPT